ncbi:MAG: hypothetical protein ACRD2I_03630 [Vicinamibacterales bacterium]
MDHPLRYVFHSHAAAFGGRIVRPKDIVLEAGGASALLVTGGRSVAQLQRTQFDEFFTVESANTLAEGSFEDTKALIEVTHRRAQEQTLAAVSRARAEVNGLAIGRKPRLSIGRIRAELTNRSAGHSGQPWFRIGKDTVIDGISIEGFKLVVELNIRPFTQCDTHAKILAAVDDKKFLSQSGETLFMSKRFGGESTPAFRKLVRAGNTIYATIVKSIRWDGRPFPKSEIHDNMVVLPDFGRVFFGEILISEYERRLTMVRMALGSDAGGSASGGDVSTNGSWSP